MASPPLPITRVPPPWTLKGTIYSFMMYISTSDAQRLSSEKSFLYSRLEASSPFSNNKLAGGLGMVQVLRYTETPVGPYDEIVVLPGNLEYEIEIEGKDGKKKVEKRKNLRVTRTYVSQERTCFNGRKNWNIPKHLANFNFTDHPDGSVSMAVYPLQPNTQGVECLPSKTPFFSATYKPMSHSPSFYSTTDWAKYVGLDLKLVAPPLPEGKGQFWEVVGTEEWCEVMPLERSGKTTLGWWDLGQGVGEETALLGGEGGEETGEGKGEGNVNWWPGMGRWRLGLKMEDAQIVFGEGKKWVRPS